MKYNRSEIMKRAWEVKRIHKLAFNACLRKAWAEAKKEAEAHAYDGVDFVDGMEITMDGVVRTLNRWTKYGNDRVYINNPNSKSNDGYVDLVARKPVGIRNYDYNRKIAAAILSMKFDADSHIQALKEIEGKSLVSKERSAYVIHDLRVGKKLYTEIYHDLKEAVYYTERFWKYADEWTKSQILYYGIAEYPTDEKGEILKDAKPTALKVYKNVTA